MKSFLFTLGLLVASTLFCAYAQDNPYLSSGRSLLGGGWSISTSGSKPDDGDPTTTLENRRFSSSLSPVYGKMYHNRWMVGLMVTLSKQSSHQQTTHENSYQAASTQSLGVGLTPFLRRYLPITERFGAYLQPELSYTYFRGTDKSENRDDMQPAANSFISFSTYRHVVSLGSQVGLYYFITNHFSVETNLLQAAFGANRSRREQTTVDNVVNSTTKDTEFNAQLSLVNQLSLDRILVLNYYF